ncbi:hypothetical protein [Tindallia magadiensis]|nr:hypothetical protein [Tindallia magadiensis]
MRTGYPAVFFLMTSFVKPDQAGNIRKGLVRQAGLQAAHGYLQK